MLVSDNVNSDPESTGAITDQPVDLPRIEAAVAEILAAIRDSGKFEDDTQQKVVAALDEFAKIFQPTVVAGAGKGSEAA